MGFYPKHLRRRQHMRNMKLIATAALSGCRFVRAPIFADSLPGWLIWYDDGQQSYAHPSKSIAAAHYLVWWFQKQNMWPRYR